MSSGENKPFRHVQSRYVPAYYGLREVLLRSCKVHMVTQEILIFLLLLLFFILFKEGYTFSFKASLPSGPL